MGPFVAGHDVHFDLRHFILAQNGVIVEVALLDTAVRHQAFPADFIVLDVLGLELRNADAIGLRQRILVAFAEPLEDRLTGFHVLDCERAETTGLVAFRIAREERVLIRRRVAHDQACRGVVPVVGVGDPGRK